MSCSADMRQPVWRTTFSGTLTNDDLLELVGKATALSEGDRTNRNGLVDLRGMSDVDIDYATLNEIRSEVVGNRQRRSVKAGIIADSPMQYGFARTMQMLLYGPRVEIQIFGDKNDALEWVSNEAKNAGRKNNSSIQNKKGMDYL